MFSSEEENEKACNSLGLLPGPRLWPGSAMSSSQKVPELSIGMFSEENSWPTSSLSLFGPNGQNLRCHWKVQEGVGGGRDHVLFSDNHEFSLFHLAFNFHQNKVFTRINVSIIKAPDSSTCGYWDSIMLCSNYTLLLLGSINVLLWAAFCWFKVRWHRDRLAKTTDIINCNLASKDEWERNALICDSELSCSIYRKTCLQGKRQTDRQTEPEA